MLFDFYDAKLIKNVTSYLKYLMKYIATGMRTGFINGTEALDASVLTYIIVIACTGEAPAQVICDQVIFRIATVSAGGAAMKDD